MAKGDLIKARVEFAAQRAAKTKELATNTSTKRQVIADTKRAKTTLEAMASPAFQRQFCELLANGCTIKSALEQFNLTYAKYYCFRKRHDEFARMVDDAIDVGYDALADECLTIADKRMETKTEIMHAKLRIETRIELLQRRSRRYNPRQQIEVSDNREVEAALRERFVSRVETAKEALKEVK